MSFIGLLLKKNENLKIKQKNGKPVLTSLS